MDAVSNIDTPVEDLQISAPDGSWRGRGQGPRGKQTPEGIWQAELLEVVKLSRKARQFAASQLQRLEDSATTVDNVNTKMKIAEMSVKLVSELTKISGQLMQQMEKRPTEQVKDADFDLGRFLADLKNA